MILELSKSKGKSKLLNPAKPIDHVNRINWVDHARGISIMLVVYRHVITGLKSTGLTVADFLFNIQEVVSNFRMPLFFILSGVFLAAGLKTKPTLKVVANRAGTLLYPYLLWDFIIICLQILFGGATNVHRQWSDLIWVITEPRMIVHLWYLFALFNTSMLYILSTKVFKKFPLVNVGVAVGLHFASFFIVNNALFSDLFFFYFYLSLGGYFSATFLNRERRDKFLSLQNLKWVLPLFVVGQFFWFLHKNEKPALEWIFIPITLIGCYTLFLTAYKISKSSRNNWLAYIGKFSLYIYILHVPFAALMRFLILHINSHTSIYVLLICCWIFGLLAPIAFINTFKSWGVEKLFVMKNKTQPKQL